MWTATIVQKGIQDKSFLVNVSFSNGKISFNEIMDLTGGTIDTLSSKIQARLTTLNATQALIPQVNIGPYTAQPSVASNSVFISTVKHFRSCQQAVLLGLIKETDQIYIDAQTAMINAYNPSFIDSL